MKAGAPMPAQLSTDTESYRGIVTTDVLVKGLSRRAIATRKLKGVNRDKGHERFILVWPLTVKGSLCLVGLVLMFR